MTVHDPARIGRLAREHFSSALMSDTKWRKLLIAVREAGLGIYQMIVKFVDVETPHVMAFPPGLAPPIPRAYMDTVFGPVELRAIEWLEFPRTAKFDRPDNLPARYQDQDIEKVAEIIAGLGQYPLEVSPEALRIIGYRR